MKNNIAIFVVVAAMLTLSVQGCHASPSPDSAHEHSVDTPCLAQARDKLKSEIFSSASNPEALWALASLATCPRGAIEEDQREMKKFIISPISYVTESFPAQEGPLDREAVIASPDDMAQLIVSSGFYAEFVKISISKSDAAILQVGNDVCTLQLDLHVTGDGWQVRGARNQCD